MILLIIFAWEEVKLRTKMVSLEGLQTRIWIIVRGKNVQKPMQTSFGVFYQEDLEEGKINPFQAYHKS